MKKTLFLIAIITLLAISLAFVGCKTTPHEKELPIGSQSNINITDAMNEICSSIEHSVTTEGATEGIYVGFSGYSKSVDSELSVNKKPTLFDFSAKIYVDSENLQSDTKSTLAFVVKQENGANKLAVYFANGKLYVDYPPIFSKVAIEGLELSNIVNNLNESKIHGGKVKTFTDLLPVFGNYIFSNCQKKVLGKCDDETCRCKGHFEYVCTLDFSKFVEGLENVLTSLKLGITSEMVLDALDLDEGELNELSKLDTKVIFNTYVQRGDDNYHYFKNLTYEKNEESVTDSFALTDFSATEFTSAVASDYKVILADNLSSYRPFNFANFDISGTFKLSMKTYNGLSELFGEQISSALVKNDFTCNYSLKSNYKGGKLNVHIVFGNIFGLDKQVELFYDGSYLYVDLSAYIGKSGKNQGYLKFSDSFAKEKLKALSVLCDISEGGANEKVFLIASLLAGLDHTADNTKIELDKIALDMFANLLGYDFILDYENAVLEFNTESNLFKGIELKLLSSGASVEFSCDNPKMGYEVLLDTPSWIKKCVNWQELSRITPVLSGRIDTNLNSVSHTMLVESLISSLTGETINLSGNVSKFIVESNYTITGKLDIFKLNFLSENNELICSIYYYTKGEARSNEIYVLLPEENGVTEVRQLKMIDSGRYTGFLNTINGNALVVDSPAEIVLGNHSNSIELSLNKNGVSDLFAFIKRIFGDFYLNELPIDFSLSNLTLSLGENITVRNTFGMNKYIELTIEDIVLDTYSLALKTTELNSHGNKTVSIFDDNDMPDVVTLTLGGENDATMQFNVADFGGWKYETVPILASGLNSVNAYVTAFGQKVVDIIKVDCANAENYAVKVDMDYAEYVDNENKAFIFDKYASEVDPIHLISTKFNSVDLQLGNKYINKQSVWSYQGKELSEATFGFGSIFTITPSITGFFGNKIALTTCSYSLTLSDMEISQIENADNYLTIYAYADFNPLSPNTYSQVDPFIVTTDGRKFKTNLEFDISSIKNVNVELNRNVLSNEELVNALSENLYLLSGKYKITANIKNSLGVQTKLDVTVTLENRIINKTTPIGLAEGVEFENFADESISGIFILDPLKIRSLSSETILSNEISVEFSASSKNEKNVKWELPKIDSVPLYAQSPISGELSVVIGDKIGGYQTFKYVYIFKSYNLTSVALTANGEEIARLDDLSNGIAFELLNQNPYTFAFPNGVVLNHDAYTLSHSDFSKTYSAGEIKFENVNWNIIGFNDSEIWYKGESYVYAGSFAVCDRVIDLKLSYVKAVIDSWIFLDENGNIFNESTPLLTTPTYEESENGAYVFVDGRYVLATDKHTSLTHYAVKSLDGGKVFYKKADSSDNVLSLTIDPNKTDYLCFDSYPTTARVTFKGITDESGRAIEFDLDLKFDLKALYESETIKSKGFYDSVPVYVAHNQKVADVNLWISGEDPTDYYCFWDEENETGSKVISVKLLGRDEKSNLILNKLGGIEMLHDLICGCDDANCLGKIYFKYDDKNTESGWFSVTEWIGLDAVRELYEKQTALGVPVEEVTGKITLTAKVGNILCSSISLSIEKSAISIPSYENYLPYANSSLNNSVADVYSMHANGVELKIDPYLANPKDASNYPAKVEFYLDGVKTVGNISTWDLSCFEGLEMYKGATGVVVALIETDFGYIKINSPTVVSERIIELVIVDGNTLPVIAVNVYSETPYGENVAYENGRTIAYKRIEVKFANDDNVYPMILKYDITDFSASFAGGMIASNVDIFVGNDAGGYQKKSGYSVYSTQNVITSIEAKDEDIKNFVADGVIYRVNDGFISFDGNSLEEIISANNAWKQLLVKCETLVVNYSYYALGNEIENTIEIRKGKDNNGISFDFARNSNDEVVLNIWNNSQSIGDVRDVQTLNTKNSKKIKLYDADFTLNSLATELVYDKTMTVATYFANYKISSIPQSMISSNNIILEMLDKNGNVLSPDSALAWGEYTLKLSVLDSNFQTVVIENGEEKESSIYKQITVERRVVNEITVLNGDREIFKNGNVYEIYEGSSLALFASSAEGFDISIVIKNADGEIVNNPEDVGTYSIEFVSLDDNYTLSTDVYTLVIKTRTIE